MTLMGKIKHLLLMSLTISAMLIIPLCPAYAEDGSAPCNLDSNHMKSAAAQAATALNSLKGYYNTFKTLVEQEITNSNGSCYNVYSWVDGSLTKEWSWGDYDVQGAKQEPDPQTYNLASLFNQVQDFKYTDLDISAYQKDNNKSLSRLNKERASRGESEELNASIKKAEQCQSALTQIISQRKAALDARIKAHNLLTTIADKSKSNCTCKADGSLEGCNTIDDSMVEDHVSEPSGCKQLNEYQAEIKTCVTCSLIETVLVGVQSLSRDAFEAVKDGLLKLLGIGLLLFIAYETLKAVSSPAQQKISQYLTTLLVQGAKVAAIIIIINDPQFIFSTLLTPVIKGGMEFGLGLSGEGISLIKQYGAKYQSFDTTNEYLPASFLQDVVGATEAFTEMAATMPAIGRSMMCNAFEDLTWYIFPHFSLLIEGAIIYVFGLAIMLSIGFYLIDCALQLGIFCSLTPFFVACWPFKITAGYTKTGWNMVMNMFFSFVMMGVVIACANEVTKQAIAQSMSGDALINALNQNDIDTLCSQIDLGGLQMLFLIVCVMLVFKLIKDVTSLANKFAPGAGIEIGGKLGGTAESIATSVGKAAGGTAMKGVKAVGRKAGAVGGAIAEATGAKGAAQAFKNKAKSFAGKLGIGGNAKMGAKGRDKGGKSGDDNGGKSGGDNGGSSGNEGNSGGDSGE